MNGRPTPRMTEPSDVRGGIVHLLAEIGALAALLVAVAALAWLMQLVL